MTKEKKLAPAAYISSFLPPSHKNICKNGLLPVAAAHGVRKVSKVVGRLVGGCVRALDGQVEGRGTSPVLHDAPDGVVGALLQADVDALGLVDVVGALGLAQWLLAGVDVAVGAAKGVSIAEEEIVLVISAGAQLEEAGFGRLVESAVDQGEVVGVDGKAADVPRPPLVVLDAVDSHCLVVVGRGVLHEEGVLGDGAGKLLELVGNVVIPGHGARG